MKNCASGEFIMHVVVLETRGEIGVTEAVGECRTFLLTRMGIVKP